MNCFKLLYRILSIAFVLLVFKIHAQVVPITLEKTKGYNRTLNRISRSADSAFNRHFQMAKKLKYKLSDTLGKGKYLRFHSFGSDGEPLYIITHSTTLAGKMTKTNSLYTGGSLGLSLNGKSNAVKGKLGMWDGGAVLESHVEFEGRATKQLSQSNTISTHATHVAGIMVAAGKNSSVVGMAPAADLKYWDFDNDASEIAAAAKDNGLIVSNHSYGYQAGWVYDESRSMWSWWGNDAASKTEDYKFGAYDDNARQLDQIAYNAPYLLAVKSAGNARTENGPDTSTTNKNFFKKYYIRNTSTMDSIPRSRNNGYDIISTNSNAKNILTIGALVSDFSIPNRPSGFVLSNYSAWGPTDDGRIKPDLVGVGSNIYSTSSNTGNSLNNVYEYNSGTSMSSPQVAGSLYLLQQLHAEKYNGALMKAATLKGIAIHTALDIGAAGPDYKTGWGVIDMEKAGQVVLKKDNNHTFSELNLKNGESYKVRFVASGKGPLVATISWTDPEGKSQGVVLNDRTPKLVNDLDLRVKDDANTYLPFILDPVSPEKLATTGDNFRDNVEKIIIPNAIPGKTYEISITHKGSITNGAGAIITQDVSLMVSGINGTALCAVSSTKTGYIKQVKINDKTSGFTLENGVSSNFEIDFNELTSGRFNAFVDWNLDGDFSDENEWIQNNVSYTNAKALFSYTIPSSASTFNNYPLRLVASTESTSGGCAVPSNGEVKDYALTISEPSYDIALEKISQSGGYFCSGTNNLYYATIRNMGAKALDKFTISLAVYEEGVLKKTYTKTVDSLAINELKDVGISTDIFVQSGKNYRYDVQINAAKDQIIGNNFATSSQFIRNSENPSVSGLSCSGSTTVALTASTNAVWWDANNLIVGTGNTISLPKGKNYFASVGGVTQSLGPKNKYEFGGGTYYSNFGPEPIYDVKTPMVLESTRIYVGTSGTIQFYVTDLNSGELVSYASVNVPATRVQTNIVAPPNQISDDPTDQGIVVNLNLQFPKAGKYAITQVCSNGASIYRSNRLKSDPVNAVTNIGFPFNSPDNIISNTGAYFQSSIIYSGYYYFYDMQFKSLGCSSDKVLAEVRESVSPTLNLSQTGSKAVCPDANTVKLDVTSNQEVSFQWQRNSVDIPGATQPSYSPTISGTYQVRGTNGNGCSNKSDSFDLTVYPSGGTNLFYNINGLLETTANKNIQWFLNDVEIPGVSTNTFTPMVSGIYSVKGNDMNGCSSISPKLTITILSTEAENSSLQIFPNPTVGDRMVVRVPKAQTNMITIEIFDLSGQLRFSKQVSSADSSFGLDVSNLSTGTYLLRIPELQQERTVKFIKN